MKNKKVRSLRILEGIFFKEDFAKLPKNVIILIKEGCLIEGR